MQQKTSIFILFLLTVVLLSSCTPAEETALPEDPGLKVTAAVQTVYAQVALTSQAEAALATATPTITLEPTFTPTMPPPTETPTNVFVGTLTSAPAEGEQPSADVPPTQPPQPTAAPQQGNSGIPCLRANLEYETIPDGTRMPVERTFTKLWRIKNTGSCTWNNNYAARFVDGDLMGAGATIPITDVDIPTNGYLMLEVEFTAPSTPDSYRGSWMLVSDDARLFGLGPNSKGWFWVEIEVFNPDA